MEKTTEAGWLVSETEEQKLPRTKPPRLTPARLRQRRKVVTHKVAEAMPAIVDALVEEARNSSVEHAQAFPKITSFKQGKVATEAPKRKGKVTRRGC